MTEQQRALVDVEFKVENALLDYYGKPKYESSEAAAVDIRAIMEEKEVLIEGGQTFKVTSGFSFHINNPWITALVIPRSGHGVRGGNLKNTIGLIDSDFQGELSCTIVNTNPPGSPPIRIEQGERLFQLVFVPIIRVNPVWVDEFSVVSARGKGGFGSTGKK